MTETPHTGTALGVPYDFRAPTWARISARVWNPGGPVFPPKVWGAGWTLNLARPEAWGLMIGIVVSALLLA